jgi:hypothetical protein
MTCNVYLDESGDLGWKFDAPYRKGGSSRYLTIAYIICPSEKKHLPKRIVKEVYGKLKASPNTEVKGSSLSIPTKEYIARKTIDLIRNNSDIQIGAITVKKDNVQPHIQNDGNKLYNYMLRLSLLENINSCDTVNLIRDNRSVKVKSGNSLIDYLQTALWFEMGAKTKIIDLPSDSKQVQNLIFIDWINNIIWSHHEDSNSAAFNIVHPAIRRKNLFF